MKGRAYVAGVRSCLMYGSETWAMTKEQEVRLERTEMWMARWMCGVKRKDRISNKVIMGRLGIEPVKDVIRMRRLGWFGHVERREEIEWIKKVVSMKVEGKRSPGRPRKTWEQTVEEDMRTAVLKRNDVWDRGYWKKEVEWLGEGAYQDRF